MVEAVRDLTELTQIYQKPISKRTIIKGLRLGRGEGLRLRGQGSPP